MITTTHAITLNGASDMEIPNDQFVEEVIRRASTLMNGQDQFAISLSRLPEGKRLWDDLPASWSDLYLQAAGCADAMMVEVRQVDPDGTERLYRLARPRKGSGAGVGTADIRWNGRTDKVPADEAFDAVEAGDIFWCYYQHNAVPEEYELRFLE